MMIIIGVSLYVISLSLDDGPPSQASAFHVILAEEALYADNGVYVDTVDIPKGMYELRFVPNGDSPRTLGVSIIGDGTSFVETFELSSSQQGTDSATYYTWDYLGQKNVTINADSTLGIHIDPYGDTRGSVSVSLVEK